MVPSNFPNVYDIETVNEGHFAQRWIHSKLLKGTSQTLFYSCGIILAAPIYKCKILPVLLFKSLSYSNWICKPGTGKWMLAKVHNGDINAFLASWIGMVGSQSLFAHFSLNWRHFNLFKVLDFQSKCSISSL